MWSFKEYYQKHGEELREKRKLYYQQNKDKERVAHKDWVEKNREHVRVYNRKYSKVYRQENKEQIEAVRQTWRSKLRIDVLTYYGNGKLACVACGENRLPCLSIDHINNEGAKERREIKPKRGKRFSGMDFYSWLKHNNYPLGYQTLCMNCQWVKKADYERILAEVLE